MDQLWKELDDFPKEILEHIISYMDSNVQLNMRLANTKWFKLVKYRTFTLKFTTEDMLPHIVDRMLQYDGPIKLKFEKIKIKKLETFVTHLSRLTNLTSLMLPHFYERGTKPEVWWGFTSLTNLRKWKVPYGCPVSVTASMVNMRELKLLLEDTDILVESMKKMSYLEHLECQNLDKSLDLPSLLPCPTLLTYLATYNMNLDQINASKLYNLRSLSYRAIRESAVRLSLDRFTALHSLRITQQHLSFGALPTTLTSLTISGDSLDPTCHQHLAAMHKLNRLSINTLNLSDEQFSWISHMTSLATVSMWPRAKKVDKGDVEPFTGAICSMIKSSKLTELAIQVTPHLDLGHLSCLTTLEDVLFNEIDCEGVIVDYSVVSHLTRLTSFALNQVGDRPSLTALANLENLKDLSAGGATPPYISRMAMSLERLTSLESLFVDKCDANVLESLSALTHLTYLHTDSLPVINYEFLTAVPLRELIVSENVHEHFYTVLVQLTGLESLNIQGLSAEQVIGLSVLQHLTELSVTNCDVDRGQHVTHLTSLRTLVLGTRDADLELIERSLPNLYSVKIGSHVN